MKLEYANLKDDGRFILTNFTCGPSRQLFAKKGLYKILWAKDNAVSLKIDGYRLELKKNEVIFCTPLNILELEKNAGLMAVVFNKEFYCIREHDAEVSCNGFLFFGSSTPPVISLCEKDVKSFKAMFLMLEEEFETRDQIQGEMLRVILKRLLIKATRLIKESNPKNNLPKSQYETVRQFHILVEQNFKEKHQVSDYADLLFKSSKTLANVFNKTGNRSPSKIINERLVLEAKRLLLHSEKTAEQIGYELGFNDAAHFSKFFKNQVGSPPGTFKKGYAAKV